MSKFRKTLTGITTAGLILGTAATGASADTAQVCVAFDTRFIRTATPETETRPLALAAGKYTVEITTGDSYEGRTHAVVEEQGSERVSVFGIVSADVADGVEAAEVVTTGSITLPTAITELTATHIHGGSGWQSVVLATVCVTPVPPPVVVHHPPVTVPEPAPTPTTVAPTPPAPLEDLPVIKTTKGLNG